MMDMIEVYNELLPERVFEVVFVALENNDLQDDSRRGVFYGKSAEERFQYLLSGMPWPAVPYSDQQARNRLKDAFVPCKGSRPYCVILDPGGKVFKCFGGGYYFSLWGAEIFPLSHERHAHMDDEDDAARNQLSLDLLLASPYRDFVTSSNGKKKVPISYLKNKVVGLYLSHNCSELPRIEKIKNLYRESKARGYDFEIVHITFHFCTQLSGNPKYKDVIQYSEDIPWLMVPYKDPVSRRLCHIFNIPLQDFWKGDCLVIIGPNGSFVEQYGAEIMEHFGIEAYPFTRDHVAKILSKRLKEEVRFVNMFDPEFPLVHRGGHEVAASKLWGMRVMLLFATYSECKSTKFVSMLKSKYGAQVEDDKFEVVFVPLDCEKPSFGECVKEMPWSVCPYSPDFAHKWMSKSFERDTKIRPSITPAVVAFDEDGVLLARESCLYSEELVIKEYPFIRDLKEVILESTESKYENYDFLTDPFYN